MNLKPLNFGLAIGIVMGVGIFLATWAMLILNIHPYALAVYEKLCPGYSLSAMGSVVALIYGLVKGTILGLLIAWVYNYLNSMSAKK